MDLESLNAWLAERNLLGFWNLNIPTHKDPVSSLKAHLWKGKDLLQGLEYAGETIGMGDSERRTVALRNPALKVGTTRTIQLSLQLVKPGEIAKAHRHNPSAIRFVVKAAPGAYTVVEGERFPMEEGDLITTPNWTWHDHYNGSNEPVIWLDGLDAHLVNYLEVWSFESFNRDQQPQERPANYSPNRYGFARPSWLGESNVPPPFCYKWRDTYPGLEALRQSAGDPFDGILLRYTNPLNHGYTLPTFSCEIQLLRPEEETRAHRHNSSAIYYVFTGSGCTEVGNESFQWEQGDVFLVPPWHWHRHKNPNREDTILFSMNDRPMLEALALYREEAK